MAIGGRSARWRPKFLVGRLPLPSSRLRHSEAHERDGGHLEPFIVRQLMDSNIEWPVRFGSTWIILNLLGIGRHNCQPLPELILRGAAMNAAVDEHPFKKGEFGVIKSIV